MFKRAIAAGAALVLSAAAAQASTLIDTGPGTVGGAALGQGQWLAAKVFIDHAAIISEIDGYIAQTLEAATSSTFSISLWNDSGDVPYQALFTADAQFPADDDGTAKWVGVATNWDVVSGEYWVVFSVSPGQTLDGTVPGTALAETIGSASSDGSSAQHWQRADRLHVPVRIFEADRLPGTPEPSTWLLMIAGFGLAGVALRRRRPAYT